MTGYSQDFTFSISVKISGIEKFWVNTLAAVCIRQNDWKSKASNVFLTKITVNARFIYSKV